MMMRENAVVVATIRQTAVWIFHFPLSRLKRGSPHFAEKMQILMVAAACRSAQTILWL